MTGGAYKANIYIMLFELCIGQHTRFWTIYVIRVYVYVFGIFIFISSVYMFTLTGVHSFSNDKRGMGLDITPTGQHLDHQLVYTY